MKRHSVLEKGKLLTEQAINNNQSKNNGKLNELELINKFNEISLLLNLDEKEKSVLEKHAENLFKDIQFTDNPGYFYNKKHNQHKEMKKYSKKNVNYILEQTRKKGRNGDTILAHINPIEAMMLKQAGGSGSINPDTGLPEFLFRGVRNFVRNPAKTVKKSFRNERAIKRTLADTAATLAAVYGGPVGGAIGGGIRAAVRKENPLIGAIKGAGYGTAAPMAANLAGQGLSAIGANSLGSTLQNYATSNMGSWMGNMAQVGDGVRGLGLPFTGSSSGNSSLNLFDSTNSLGASDYLKGASALSRMGDKGQGVSAGADYDFDDAGDEDVTEYIVRKGKKGGKKDLGFFDKLKSNSLDFVSKPKNLLALGTAGLSLYDRFNKPKPKTPEQEGKDAKAKLLAQRLTPKELAEQEAYELEQERARRRIARKKFLPEERIDIEPIYNRVSSPQEYAQTGRWLNYYDNPQFTGTPIRF